MSIDTRTSTDRRAHAAVWLPGLAVAVGAAVATAHGLFEVAVAARVPTGIAWIYPLITDGLALVAYAATARLRGSAARYAWTVVVVSAGLSGLAQAAYLASDAGTAGGGLAVNPALRFGVGAWPAIAAAVVAHLPYLLAAHRTPDSGACDLSTSGVRASDRTLSDDPAPALGGPLPSALDGPVLRPPEHPLSGHEHTCGPVSDCAIPAGPAGRPDVPSSTEAPARERARVAAERHQRQHGVLPSVRDLQAIARVGRGTAADALKRLRDDPAPSTNALHIVPDQPDTRTQP